MHAPTIHHAGGVSRWLKALGLIACAVPLGVLLMFAVGEGLEGWGHLLQAAPLVLLVVLAWWRPLIGGALIALVGIGLAAVFTLGGPGDPQMDPSANLFVYWVLFAPAIVGGLLLAAAGWVKTRET
jgi:hypothetical protein